MQSETRKKTDRAPASPDPLDLRAEIEKRAYAIWLNECGGHGRNIDHWLRAKSEIAELQLARAKAGASSKASDHELERRQHSS